MTRSFQARLVATVIGLAVASSCGGLAHRNVVGTLSARVDPCRVLSLALGRTARRAGSAVLDLVLTNDGPAGSCSMMNNPDVELLGPALRDRSAEAVVWQLGSDRAKTARLTLAEGESAHVALTYLPAAPDEDPWTPGYVVVRPQGQVPLALPWKLGPITFQEMATRPGTYVGHVEPGRR